MARNRWRYTHRATVASYGLPVKIALTVPWAAIVAVLTWLAVTAVIAGSIGAALWIVLLAVFAVPSAPLVRLMWEPTTLPYTSDAEDANDRMQWELDQERRGPSASFGGPATEGPLARGARPSDPRPD